MSPGLGRLLGALTCSPSASEGRRSPDGQVQSQTRAGVRTVQPKAGCASFRAALGPRGPEALLGEVLARVPPASEDAHLTRLSSRTSGARSECGWGRGDRHRRAAKPQVRCRGVRRPRYETEGLHGSHRHVVLTAQSSWKGRTCLARTRRTRLPATACPQCFCRPPCSSSTSAHLRRPSRSGHR